MHVHHAHGQACHGSLADFVMRGGTDDTVRWQCRYCLSARSSMCVCVWSGTRIMSRYRRVSAITMSTVAAESEACPTFPGHRCFSCHGVDRGMDGDCMKRVEVGMSNTERLLVASAVA